MYQATFAPVRIAEMDFVKWIKYELRARRWRQTDLAQAMGVADSTVSQVLSKERKPGQEFCNKIAEAFAIPPEQVFRKAGLMPDLPADEDDRRIKELTEAFKQLPEPKRREILQYIHFQLQIFRSQGDALPEDRQDNQ